MSIPNSILCANCGILYVLKLGYAMHTQWYVIYTILLHTSGVFRFGMKYTPLYAHYLMALAPPI